ncbi:homing endonuclease associated repeat-containing protein [Halosimplex amylolyticum]|uniref:homing endonuclease associated repeat-containing protein n=1 Tax=Halosimplex amylolyticum TaxID=3396616 RepID=UPI003F5436ED
MTGTTCPVETCSFQGSISAIGIHITETKDEQHSWRMLEYDDADEFRRDAHLEVARRRRKTGRELHDRDEFEAAVDELETALSHFQRAQLLSDRTLYIEQQCQQVLDTIRDVETDRLHQIDELIDSADNTVDAGGELHLDASLEAASEEYDEAIEALEAAVELAAELAPERVPAIDQELRRVRVRRQSLTMSSFHRTIRDTLAEARSHVAAGDSAFHASDYDEAVSEYEDAHSAYESLAAVLEKFSFAEPTHDLAVCDVCRQQFEEEFDGWTIEVDAQLAVCPACAEFGSGGILPTPRDIAIEQRTVVENISSIRDKDVGLEWTSTPGSSRPTTNEHDIPRNNLNQRDMVVQLVALYQTVGRAPTNAELDEHTEFGSVGYHREFGTLADAFEAAGFEP